jgi:hypothetical protein
MGVEGIVWGRASDFHLIRGATLCIFGLLGCLADERPMGKRFIIVLKLQGDCILNHVGN